MTKQRLPQSSGRFLKALAGILLVAGLSARGATTLFSENFKGPQLNPLWVATLPTAPVAQGDAQGPESYVGAPNYVFTTISNVLVLRMNTVLAPAQRAGWSLNTNFDSSDFRYEVRFNTLTQSSDTSIDAFIEIWILDSSDPTRYDLVSPFGGDYDMETSFVAGSSISGATTDQGFTYQNNTYYRLVLHGSASEDIRAAICDDNDNELVGYDLGHNTTAYPAGFTIGLSQAVDRPVNSAPTDVAVASLNLTSGDTTIPFNITPAVQISWPTIAGRFYQLQSSPPGRPGRPGSWTNVGEPVAGTGEVMTFLEPDQHESVLYRIEMLP